ncbi:MAG TPA: methylated-DNA--[protein]-cysteine S-methyltransferase [Steroidobacteraceae bacterium]|nr:methylated-DNA--[protein]-cysteine S-methyltransferase [Steroidobacteraceae bacterium]
MNYHAYVDSPIGRLRLYGDERAVTALVLDPQAAPIDAPARGGTNPAVDPGIEDPRAGVLPVAARQLAEYFAGARHTFALPLAARGSPFQERVWRALLGIAYGRTQSYGEIARRIGQPAAARAVGMANNRNPLPIFVPCHRVIGADGTLVGYGGGLERKRWLLTLESTAGAAAANSRQ